MNFETPLTYLITRGETSPQNFEHSRNKIVDLVRSAGRAGISIVQIREKKITAKQLFELTVGCRNSLRPFETKLVINGRPDVAKAAEVDGVHLPENSVPIGNVRASFPKPFIIGASVHNAKAALEAKNAGADYVMFGPVFDSPGKIAKGIAELEDVCKVLGDFPVIAVGGISATNYSQILDSGAAGFAAIRYLNDLVRTK